jgi:hypothetical protein
VKSSACIYDVFLQQVIIYAFVFWTSSQGVRKNRLYVGERKTDSQKERGRIREDAEIWE